MSKKSVLHYLYDPRGRPSVVMASNDHYFTYDVSDCPNFQKSKIYSNENHIYYEQTAWLAKWIIDDPYLRGFKFMVEQGHASKHVLSSNRERVWYKWLEWWTFRNLRPVIPWLDICKKLSMAIWLLLTQTSCLKTFNFVDKSFFFQRLCNQKNPWGPRIKTCTAIYHVEKVSSSKINLSLISMRSDSQD